MTWIPTLPSFIDRGWTGVPGKVRHGEIILVSAVLDPQGRNPEDRPCLVLTTDQEIRSGEPIFAACITGLRMGTRPPLDTVAMRYHPRGRGRTGLKKPSVVACRWVIEVALGRIIRTIGHNPPDQMLEVSLMMARLVREKL